MDFHKEVMPSERILKLAIEEIAKIPFTLIAPQHGSIIHKAEDIILVCEKLSELKGVGIDGIGDSRPYNEIGNMEALKKRLLKK